MTDIRYITPEFEHKLRRRALVEEAAFAYEDEDGIEFADSICGATPDKLFRLAGKAHEHPANLTARTMEVKGDAMTLIAPPDVAAFQAVFDDIDHD